MSVSPVKTFCIDIGGTKCSFAGFEDSRMVLRETRPTDRDTGPAGVMEQFLAVANKWRHEGFTPDRCGIGFGGPVDFPTQSVTLSTHVAGWSQFPLVQEVQRELFGIPVLIDNDANVGALGEAFYGAGQGADPLFYMTLSTGIGGGLVSQGAVYRGADSFAGELGHIAIQPDGPECLCGANGCFERMACGLWLERDYRKTANELLQSDDFISRYVVNLARGLKPVIMLLNPARIVIGGGISKTGDRLFSPLRAELRKQITAWSRARIDVQPAALGDDSILFGALALAGSQTP